MYACNGLSLRKNHVLCLNLLNYICRPDKLYLCDRSLYQNKRRDVSRPSNTTYGGESKIPQIENLKSMSSYNLRSRQNITEQTSNSSSDEEDISNNEENIQNH